MKYLIFAAVILLAVNADGTCFSYGCASIGTANACVGQVGTTSVINVNTCAAGNMCPYAGVFALSQIANTNCMTTPTPTPLTGLIPGDVCSTANKDTCN